MVLFVEVLFIMLFYEGEKYKILYGEKLLRRIFKNFFVVGVWVKN